MRKPRGNSAASPATSWRNFLTRIIDVKQIHHANQENPDPIRNLDANGRVRRRILEIHLVSCDEAVGGFYERLLVAGSGNG
jgi:hypothetical protein